MGKEDERDGEGEMWALKSIPRPLPHQSCKEKNEDFGGGGEIER